MRLCILCWLFGLILGGADTGQGLGVEVVEVLGVCGNSGGGVWW